MMKKFCFRTILKKPASEVLGWHLRESSLQRILPPWMKITFTANSGKPDQLGKISCVAKIGFFHLKAQFQYKEFGAKEYFTVEQIRGVFTHFRLMSCVKDMESRSCELTETVQYALPWFLRWIDVQGRIERIFRYKHALIERDLDIFERYPYDKPSRILISGAHGFVGSQLVPFLECAGHEVYSLVRAKSDHPRHIYWCPDKKEIELSKLEGFNAVIHLSGESIGSGEWTQAKRQRIIASRKDSTDFLAKSLASLAHPPQTFLCASAMGYYGDCGRQKVDEEHQPQGDFFLSKVCRLWEEACLPIKNRRTRVVIMRFGLILGRQGGILKRILPLFRWGLGGRLGNGNHYMSWIAIDDLLAAIYHLMMRPNLEGPFNISSPHPVTNQQFTQDLASALNRWIGPPVPAFLLRLLMGQKADEIFLSSQRLDCKKLSDSGFFFRYPTLRQALDHVL